MLENITLIIGMLCILGCLSVYWYRLVFELISQKFLASLIAIVGEISIVVFITKWTAILQTF